MSRRFMRCMKLKRKLNNVVMNVLSFIMCGTFALAVVTLFLWVLKMFIKQVGVM